MPATALVHQALLERALARRKRGKRLPPQLHPTAIIATYYEAIRSALGGLHRRVMADLKPVLEQLEKETITLDATSHKGAMAEQEARRVIVAAKKTSFDTDRLEELATKIGNATSKHQQEQLAKQARAAIGIQLPSLLSATQGVLAPFVKTNVSLIQTLPARYATRIEKVIGEGFDLARRADDVAADLEQAFDSTKSDAARIARDQVGKLTGQLNAVRQTALGIERFTWSTSQDERVRPEHQELEGQIFPWDDPPAEGLPGTPIMCRCVGTPVFEDLLDE